MKRKFMSLLLIPLLFLTSCDGGIDDASSHYVSSMTEGEVCEKKSYKLLLYK